MSERSEPATRKKILIVQDEITTANDLARSLRNLGYDIAEPVSSALDVIGIVESSEPDLILMDLNPEGEVDGIEAASRIQTQFDVPVVYLTESCDAEVLDRAGRTEAYGCVGKAAAVPELRCAIEIALHKHQADRRVRESEQRFKRLAENAQDVLYCMSIPDGRYEYVSPASSQTIGYTPEEFYSNPKLIRKIIHPAWQAYFEKEWENLTRGQMPASYEYQIVHKSGEVRWMNQRNVLVRNKLGEPIAIEGIVTDITERKRLEEALEKNEREYRTVFSNAALGIDLVDREGRFIQVNQPLAEMLGYSQEELVGRTFLEFTHPEDVEPSQASHEDLVQGKYQSYQLQKRYVKKDGTLLWVEVTISALYNECGEYEVTVGVIADITERKRAELALRESEEKYYSIVEYMGDAYFEVDLAGNMVFCNDSTCRLSGYTREELVGMNYRAYTDESTAKVVFDTFHRVFRTGEPAILSAWDAVAKDGTWGKLETHISLIRDADGNRCGFRGYSRDVTEKKEAEAALLESEAKYRAIIENIEEGIHEVDLSGNMVFCNDAMCRILGYSRNELIGMNYRQYMDESTGIQVFRVFNSVYRTGNPLAVSGFEFITKDGSRRSIDASISLIRDPDGEPIGYRGIMRDVTERDRLQKQSMQAQKMEAIGTLAGGIAHDFNNILNAVIGFTELSLDEVTSEGPQKQYLSRVLQAGQRAKDLVNQILSFSRRTRQERRPINVAPIVKEGIRFLRASLPSTIEIRKVIEPDLRSVVADPTEIHQIVMNLCSNAGHAMRETGGLLELRVENVDVDSRHTTVDPELAPGAYVCVTVSDTGTGVAAEDIPRIFEPYFTTKEKGEGTGLGLAVVHGIASGYGGAIQVHSEVERGSTFQVFLPAVEDTPMEEPGTIDAPPGGNERILFVDDEPMTVEMAEQILKRLGYAVTSKTSSLEALDLFQAKPDEFDLIIADVTMPNLTGVVFAQEIRKISPTIPLILCTGFSHLVTKEKMESLGITELVTKPILRKDMAEAIRRVLDR